MRAVDRYLAVWIRVRVEYEAAHVAPEPAFEAAVPAVEVYLAAAYHLLVQHPHQVARRQRIAAHQLGRAHRLRLGVDYALPDEFPALVPLVLHQGMPFAVRHGFELYHIS